MRYLSVCSGIEAASVAWRPLGWQPIAFSEIDAFACAVLAHHYPDVPNWGDMSQHYDWPDATVDLICGGTPCQSFSVAGAMPRRAEMPGHWQFVAGARSALDRAED
ncbi:MAG: DNA cytosine methyltransferase [Sinobacteraceae bacterium]|nr:DNA cytosine methyltransferase [Nevskiaceae bacterium]